MASGNSVINSSDNDQTINLKCFVQITVFDKIPKSDE